MAQLAKWIFRTVKTLFLIALIIVISGAAFFASIRETIPGLSVAPAPSTVSASAEFAEVIEQSRNDVVAVRQRDFYPSMSISVFRDGEELWTEAIGLDDLRDERRATPATLYPIGSISKPLTATLVMQLVSDGIVDLDAPISQYAPTLPASHGGLTLRQLLSHQAGIRHYKFAWIPPAFTENGMNREFASAEESLSIFIDDPLLFAPDTSFQYSTYGYTLISYVLEEASGVSFLDLMKEKVFDRAAMNETVPDRVTPRARDRSTDYMSVLKRLGLFQSPKTNSSYKWAGGGFLSTPRQLAQFGDGFMHHQILDARAFAVMTTPRHLTNGEINPQYYGLGWRGGNMTYPSGSEDLTPIIHHGGTAVGAQCGLLLAPEFSITVSVCGNAYTGGSGGLIQLAADIARNFHDAVKTENE